MRTMHGDAIRLLGNVQSRAFGVKARLDLESLRHLVFWAPICWSQMR